MDDYAEKLVNSGYNLGYTRKVIVGGLTGYERKLSLSRNKDHPKWKPLHQGAKFNAEGRRRKKMMAKKNWFKKRKESEDDMEQEPGRSPTKKRRYEDGQEEQKDGNLEGGTSLLYSQVEGNPPQSPKTIFKCEWDLPGG